MCATPDHKEDKSVSFCVPPSHSHVSGGALTWGDLLPNWKESLISLGVKKGGKRTWES
jgi:hypothetical protein